MLRFLLGIVATLLIVVGALWLLQRRLIYFPAPGVPPVDSCSPDGRKPPSRRPMA